MSIYTLNAFNTTCILLHETLILAARGQIAMTNGWVNGFYGWKGICHRARAKFLSESGTDGVGGEEKIGCETTYSISLKTSEPSIRGGPGTYHWNGPAADHPFAFAPSYIAEKVRLSKRDHGIVIFLLAGRLRPTGEPLNAVRSLDCRERAGDNRVHTYSGGPAADW